MVNLTLTLPYLILSVSYHLWNMVQAADAGHSRPHFPFPIHSLLLQRLPALLTSPSLYLTSQLSRGNLPPAFGRHRTRT